MTTTTDQTHDTIGRSSSSPPGRRRQGRVIAVTAAVAVVVALGLQLAIPATRIVDDLAGLLLAAALLGSGLLFHVHWMLTHWASSAWLVLGATSAGAYVAVSTVARLLDPTSLDRASYLEAAGFVALLGALAAAGGRHMALDWRTPPLQVGLTSGALLGTAVVVLQTTTAVPPLPGTAVRWILTVGLLATGGCLALLVHRHLGTPPSTRLRIVGTTLAVTGALAARLVGDPLDALEALLNVVAAALVLTAAHSLTSRSIWNHHRALDTLRTTIEEEHGTDRARLSKLHEVRATIGGLTQAVQVLQQPGVPPHRRGELQVLIDEELQRLGRLTQPRRADSAGPVDLDTALETVVLRQRLHGQRVLWQPSGHRAWARVDDVVGIVGALLDNSRVHAPGSVCLVEVASRDPGQVTITVSDTGRGVAPELRESLFTWQGKHAASPGQGIGLVSARRLARDNGGDLTMDAGAGHGATFVLVLGSAGRALRLSPLHDPHVQQYA